MYRTWPNAGKPQILVDFGENTIKSMCDHMSDPHRVIGDSPHSIENVVIDFSGFWDITGRGLLQTLVCVDPTWFWSSNMVDYEFFRDQTEFEDGWYHSFSSTMSVCNWPASPAFNVTTCDGTFREFLSLKSIQTTSDHVPDIPAHLRIPPDRLNTQDSEFSSRPCLDHQNHDFPGN